MAASIRNRNETSRTLRSNPLRASHQRRHTRHRSAPPTPIPQKDTIIPNWLPATHIQGNYYLLPPKTKQGKRFIPISTPLWIQLNERIQKQHIKPNQLIFTLDNKPLNSVKERRRWKQALDAAGLPYTTMRAARHFFSTQLAQIGASEDARTSMMGHAKITTTAGYTHWNPTTLATLANQARQAINQ